MTETIVQYALHLFVFIVVCLFAASVLEEFEQAAADLKEHQGKGAQASLADLYIFLSPQTILSLKIVCAVVCFLPVYGLLDIVSGLIAGVLGFFAPAIYFYQLRKKRVVKVEQQLVEALELLGNSLKSGLTLPQACELLVKEFPPPISQEFSMLLAENRLGVEFTEALENMAVRLKSNIVFILASGVSITKRCGGDLTQIFTNIANTIREQANIEGKLFAVTAQGRFQGLILGLMPFALLIVLYFIDPGHVEYLFKYQIGIYAFCAVIVMVILAQVWIHKLLDIDV